jgi:hypothetical protein|tara:strand:+ start:511 stop:822 length:312 start_codon:yes stop_codon:yes gene_type:complete
MAFFEISTTKYKEDIKLLQVAMTKMSALCNIATGFKFGEPVSRFGWTFFQMFLDQELYVGIEDEFSDMIKKCKGNKPDEKFINFLNQYFESKGCNVKVKMVND